MTRTAAALLLLLFMACQAHAAAHTVILYTVGTGGDVVFGLMKQLLVGRGYDVDIVQGETDIEKHVDKVNGINGIPGAVFIAVEVVASDKGRVMVAETEAKKAEGRFLSITEIASRYAAESDRLAADVAAPFHARISHLPLFPLLGVAMPGIAVRLELSAGQTPEMVSKLCGGVDKYFQKGQVDEKQRKSKRQDQGH